MKIPESRNSGFGEILMYMWNFIASQGVESRWSKHAFWKLQVLNISFLQIIVTTAFSTFLVTLLSTKYFDVPFKELDDFATIRTHNICNAYPNVQFKGAQWKDIVNQPACDKFFKIRDYKSIYEVICNAHSHERLAYVVPGDLVNKFRCTVVKLDSIIPKPYLHVSVRPDFPYKELFDRFLIRMKATGIISRMENSFELPETTAAKFVDRKEDYKFDYNVATRGVRYMQVSYIFLPLIGMLLLGFIVLCIEWIVFVLKHFLCHNRTNSIGENN